MMDMFTCTYISLVETIGFDGEKNVESAVAVNEEVRIANITFSTVLSFVLQRGFPYLHQIAH